MNLVSDEELDDEDHDPDFTYKKAESEVDTEEEEIHDGNQKLRKRRWGSEENAVFKKLFGKYLLNTKTMPPSSVIQLAASKYLTQRSVAQIRVRVHNILTGKQTLS